MADFSIYTPLPGKTLRTGSYMNVEATFVGFDTLDASEVSTEATHAKDLGQRMSAQDRAIFADMEPGTRVLVDGKVYAYNG